MIASNRRTLTAAILLIVPLVLSGCDEVLSDLSDDPTSKPSRLPPPKRAPIVWLSGRLKGVTEDDFAFVLDRTREEVRVHRLAEGPTRFLERTADRWTPLEESAALTLATRTPACVESLLEGTAYFALRVFVGAHCGPTAA